MVVSIIGTLAIGWYVPQVLIRSVRIPFVGLIAVICALLLGALFVWTSAQVVGVLDMGDARAAFERGFNAWKVMLFVAPASALQATKHKTRDEG